MSFHISCKAQQASARLGCGGWGRMCPDGAANARTPTSRDTFALSADPLIALSLPYVSPPHIHCAGVLDQIKITGDDDKPLLLDTPAHEPP